MSFCRNRFDVSYSSGRTIPKKRDITVTPAHRQHPHVSIDSSGPQRSSITLPTSLPSCDTNTLNGDLEIVSEASNSNVFAESPLHDDDLARGDDFDRQLEAEGLIQLVSTGHPLICEKQKRKRTQADHPLLLWIPHIDHFVEEFLRLEGLGDSSLHCAGTNCSASLDADCAAHRCLDCTDVRLFCSSCILNIHLALPLHRIERWNGRFFDLVTLKSLGLRIQLGHTIGECCSAPSACFDDDFVVIDLNGIHEVSLQYCGCQQSLLHVTQLLRHGFFPSTTTNPQTAATFRLLEFIQLLGFTSGASVYEIYKTIARTTDNTGTVKIRDRYHTLLRMLREWRHIRLLKRMGRGHAADGVRGTPQGACAVPCLACPRPGINIPSDYRSQPESRQFLYSLFVGLDANFCLKRMNVSSRQRDPGLNHGYAYIVEDAYYKQYLKDFDTVIGEDKSTCNNHDAIKSANMRGTLGTEASGAATVECSRHDMKRPTSVGDLQKGERYLNMDYLFLRSLQHNPPSQVVVSYDIACQWSKNLTSRCEEYPPSLISTNNLVLDFLVPKFHLPAHIDKCQAAYSFNYIPGMGRTDGEAPERGWSDSNEISSSTKEMGPGSRHDTLDDHFGDYNWRKTMALGETYVRKVNEALPAREHQVGAFLEFTCALPASCILEWTSMVQEWERDRSKPNPFLVPRTYISDKEVRLRLAQEEETALRDGKVTFVHGEVTPAILIYQGLELEDQQRRLGKETSQLGAHATELQRSKVLERANMLRQKVNDWCNIQQLYVPSVAFIRASATSNSPLAAQDIELLLPSAIADRQKIHCDIRLSRVEWLLRYAQAEGCLHELRGHILLRSRLYQSKKRLIRGQRQQTRSQAVIGDVEAKVKASAEKYRYIHECLTRLSPVVLEFNWQNILKPLEDNDIAGLTYMDDGAPEKTQKRKGLGEGHKQLSWIWLVQGTGQEVDASTQAALRLEWCKARARAHRWQEECLFLAEEMRRIKESLEYEAKKWDKRTVDVIMIQDGFGAAPCADELTLAGKIAYAHRQASIRRKMKASFEVLWTGLSEKLVSMEDGDAYTMIEAPREVHEAAASALEDGSNLATYLRK
ncbi:hypothetical protein CPB83DRAFT_898542 [Crepidotus variabilis]|uniref:CxC2-like cysteine cluster KDZ transposase-associated domain-containing protein n=1 Tax=Crepidotus variabilis TaxID=179855 RepID=A0A9P6E7A8_9AGAR|nr:hypothetical protein CPB83DRAFT_898542 [Crepidotus variabilis]